MTQDAETVDLRKEASAVPHFTTFVTLECRPVVSESPNEIRLTVPECGRLSELETTIGAGLKTFFAVGEALLIIKRERLYRANYSSFEQYCRDRWNISRAHAYRLLTAAELTFALSPTGDIPLPKSERQIRPLLKLEPKLAAAAWRLAVQSCRGNQITAKNVEAAVKQITDSHADSIRAPEATILPQRSQLQFLLSKEVKRINLLLRGGNLSEILFVMERIKLLIDRYGGVGPPMTLREQGMSPGRRGISEERLS